MGITAITPAITTEPVTRPAAPAAVAAPGDSAQARPLAGDSLQRTTPVGSAPAAIALDKKPADDGVDFTKLFTGFAVGGKIKIGCSIPLAGGKGTIQALDPHHLKLSGHVSVAGLVNTDLDVDIHADKDGTYRMSGTTDLHVSIKQQGNKVTITDLDSPTHHVYLTAKGSGAVDVKTVGMGFDSIGAKVRAK
jgi:hypothetical protein